MTGPGAVLERGPVRPPVDPRLRARRIEVRRREGRRRLRRLVALLVLTVVCAGAWGLSRSALFDVDHIEVSGVRRADPDRIVVASGIARGDALVDLDLPAAEAAIAELGWIASVEATKAWGGTVHLAVVERRPVAVAVAGDGSRWLVDAQGQVIDTASGGDGTASGGDGTASGGDGTASGGDGTASGGEDSASGGEDDLLPVIEGIAVPAPGRAIDPGHRRAVGTATGLTPALSAWVEAIVVDADGELWLDLVSPPGSPLALVDARARLGDGRDLAAQLVAVETILARVELECLAVIDARVGSAPVVTRHEPCQGRS